MTNPTAATPKLLGSLRQLSATALGMVQTRLALAGLEIEEELHRWLGLLLNALGVLVFGIVGLLVLTLLVIMSVADAWRVGVGAAFVAIYLILAIKFWMGLQRGLLQRPAFLQATLDELSRDHAALKGGAALAPAPSPPREPF